ncbi:MAG TPA: hypothetical protein DC049_01540 [Spirochaetia bacterium]|nr:hypothetical protein [Spirochaetia bacterium]
MKEKLFPFSEMSSGQFPLGIRMAGIDFQPESKIISGNTSAKSVLEYVIAGKAVLRVDGLIFYPGAGDMYILPAGSNFEYYPQKNIRLYKIWFNVQGYLFRELLSAYRIAAVYHFPKCPVNYLFRRGLRIARRGDKASSELCALIHQIIIEAARFHEEKYGNNNEALGIQKFIDTNIEQKINIDKIFSRLTCGRSTAFRLFRTYTGMSPHVYSARKKIELAYFYLVNTRLPIHEISARLHFYDAFHFSREFKKHRGISPAALRRNTTAHFPTPE